MGSGDRCLCHFLCWHNGNGEALPTANLTDSLYHLVHHAVMLGIASLDSLALGALSIQDAGGVVAVVDFDAVGRLQHWVVPLTTLVV